MRILFVHEVNWRRKVRFEIHEIPELLSVRGHEVDFLDFPEGEHPAGLKRFLDLQTTVSEVRSHTISGSRIRVITPGRVFAPPLDRLVATVTFVPVLSRLLRSQQYDAVFLYGVPTNGWQAVILARRAGVPVLYRGIDVSHRLRRTIFSPLIRRSERFIYRHASHVSTNNVALQQYCVAEGSDTSRTTVDYPGVDMEHFAADSERAQLRRHLGYSPDHRVVLYMGTFFRFSGLEVLVREYVEQSRTDPKLRLLLVGDGEIRSELEKLILENGVQHLVTMTGIVDYKQLPRYLSCADVAVTPFRPSLVSDKALPWKVVQYIAAGLPVVSTRLEGLMGLFPEGHGVLYSENETGVWKQVARMFTGEVDSVELVQLGQSIIRTKCDWTTNISHFEGILARLAEDARGRQ